MASESDITDKLWKAIKSDRTIMLGLVDGRGGDSQPMTALFEDEPGVSPLWIFSSSDVDLVKAVGSGSAASAQFASKDHEVFAALSGNLSVSVDRSMIDRLWNPFAAAWYEGGKDDPKLRLLRFDLDHAHVWLNENSIFAMIKLMLGSDPKKDYKDKVADVPL
ncbi:MAG: general stress protein [Burkholderiales bacterium]|nr:MAG: general stress protein [Burkholderiales bacterium]